VRRSRLEGAEHPVDLGSPHRRVAPAGCDRGNTSGAHQRRPSRPWSCLGRRGVRSLLSTPVHCAPHVRHMDIPATADHRLGVDRLVPSVDGCWGKPGAVGRFATRLGFSTCLSHASLPCVPGGTRTLSATLLCVYTAGRGPGRGAASQHVPTTALGVWVGGGGSRGQAPAGQGVQGWHPRYGLR